MLFSSLLFLYYFLPIVLILYFITPTIKFKNIILLIMSLVFYTCGEPIYLFLMVLEILILWILGLLMDKYREKRNLFLFLSLFVGLGTLLFFKYGAFINNNINAVFGLDRPFFELALPIGISFYTFQILSYSIDLFRGKVEVQKNLLDFACYVVLFPQLIAGPIVRYADIADELSERTHNMSNFSNGAFRFVIGLSKKVLLANTLGELAEILISSNDVMGAWIYIFAYSMHIYFDFSGYSDMAIGLGLMFGFHFAENFNYPYTSKSITEFWRRWHISMSSWFRDYVYIPLGGSRVKKSRFIFNLIIVWALTGFWHGASWNFIVWGLYFGILLLLEKSIPKLQKLPLPQLYVLFFVCIGWVLFDSSSFNDAWDCIKTMFGFGADSLVSFKTLYYLRSYALLIIIGIIGCTPIVKKFALKFKALQYIKPLIILILLVVITAFLVDSSFNPFIYFRF